MSGSFEIRPLRSLGRIPALASLVVVVCLALATPVAGATAAVSGDASGATFPTDAAEALAVYESNIDSWADGPVEYLMLEHERDVWKRMTSVEDKERFIRWFWERRDEDLRSEGNAFREAFYERVAEANRRFRGFPRGWRSDRGRVWVVLGRPDSIRGHPSLALDIWTYYTTGRERAFASTYGEITIGFRRTGPASHEILGDLAPGVWPHYVLEAFEYTRQAAVTNSDLGLRSAS